MSQTLQTDDVRLYTCDGQVLLHARLYQGQTTNFRRQRLRARVRDLKRELAGFGFNISMYTGEHSTSGASPPALALAKAFSRSG